jgi:hypothetical protein
MWALSDAMAKSPDPWTAGFVLPGSEPASAYQVLAPEAYTQVKNFLIGQTFSNFQDPDSGPDTLDFQGPNSQVAIRNPQIRYTFHNNNINKNSNINTCRLLTRDQKGGPCSSAGVPA